MKRLITWILTGVAVLVGAAALALSGCGGGDGNSQTVVDINNLEDGYTVTYTTGINTPQYDIAFCLNEYNLTLSDGNLESNESFSIGNLESNGSFSIDNQFDRIVFDEDANGSNDFQIETSGELRESEWYDILDMGGVKQNDIQILDIIAEINCTV